MARYVTVFSDKLLATLFISWGLEYNMTKTYVGSRNYL